MNDYRQGDTIYILLKKSQAESVMNDTIEQIVKAAKEAVKCYGGDDQYMILEEVSRRLKEEGHTALMVEYLGEEVVNDEQ